MVQKNKSFTDCEAFFIIVFLESDCVRNNLIFVIVLLP